MTDKEKLIEMLHTAIKEEMKSPNFQSANIADYLLANGVVVLPCKAGDTVYYPSSFCDKIFEKTIDEILMHEKGDTKGTYIHFASTYIPLENIGITVFLTREEAEKALKGEVKGTN